MLISERLDHPITKASSEHFSDIPGVRFIPGAVPLDLLTCIEDGASHIAWVAHAAELPWTPEEATLAYFRENDLASGPKLVHPRIFQRILTLKPATLRRISFMSCTPEQVRRHYPELAELERHGIEIHFAPVNRFLSFFHGKEVVSMDPDWIAEQIAPALKPRY